jgi:hypothetical protein
MSERQFRDELATRGFHWSNTRSLWVGPFGLTVTGVLNVSNVYSEPGRDNPMGMMNSGRTGGGIGPGVSGMRKSVLADVDEQLRAKRGLPRPHFRPNNATPD